ncbi:hypothetical protein J6590_050441 [Homalodisca vitripennis]|nr:hypothetical protein J6590_050441 [Homalodisca vitripennis]
MLLSSGESLGMPFFPGLLLKRKVVTLVTTLLSCHIVFCLMDRHPWIHLIGWCETLGFRLCISGLTTSGLTSSLSKGAASNQAVLLQKIRLKPYPSSLRPTISFSRPRKHGRIGFTRGNAESYLYVYVILTDQGPKWPAPDLSRSDPSTEQIHSAQHQKRSEVSPRALDTPKAILDIVDQSSDNLYY